MSIKGIHVSRSPSVHQPHTLDLNQLSTTTQGPAYCCMQGSANGVERPYKPPLTCCCMRGVAVVRKWSKGHKSPHPTHCCMQGKLQQCKQGRKAIETTSISLLHARKVVVMQKGLKQHKTHLHLAIACKGGGSSANGVEKT